MDPILDKGATATQLLASLRQMILSGDLAAGVRLAEIPMAERFKVSRTPVRLAFRALEQEGLLEPANKRGYVVRRFTDTDVRAAIEVRGVLEGLAARHVAEHGLMRETREAILLSIQEGSAILRKGYIESADITSWSQLNKRFHEALIHAQQSKVVEQAIARNNHLPFASADSLVIDESMLEAEFQKLKIAHVQHQLVLEALEQGESARVEMLMREHAWVGYRYSKFLSL